MEAFKDQPVSAFESPAAWRAWLEQHHAESNGLWLRIYKKGTGHPTVTYAEALDEALCYGWIDSTKQKYDAESFLQRFSPRKPRSVWSKLNREHVARLTAAGKMTPAGQKTVDDAKADGRWEAAYDASSTSSVPEDLQAALDAHPQAKPYFEGLNRVNRYAILHRIQTVKKAETRMKKVAWALELLRKQEKIYP